MFHLNILSVDDLNQNTAIININILRGESPHRVWAHDRESRFVVQHIPQSVNTTVTT